MSDSNGIIKIAVIGCGKRGRFGLDLQDMHVMGQGSSRAPANRSSSAKTWGQSAKGGFVVTIKLVSS